MTSTDAVLFSVPHEKSTVEEHGAGGGGDSASLHAIPWPELPMRRYHAFSGQCSAILPGDAIELAAAELLQVTPLHPDALAQIQPGVPQHMRACTAPSAPLTPLMPSCATTPPASSAGDSAP